MHFKLTGNKCFMNKICECLRVNNKDTDITECQGQHIAHSNNKITTIQTTVTKVAISIKIIIIITKTDGWTEDEKTRLTDCFCQISFKMVA